MSGDMKKTDSVGSCSVVDVDVAQNRWLQMFWEIENVDGQGCRTVFKEDRAEN